jgi:hypothetical protein
MIKSRDRVRRPATTTARSSGASREALGRRGADQRRRRDRSRDEGEEGPRRGRAACLPGRGRRGHPAGRRHRVLRARRPSMAPARRRRVTRSSVSTSSTAPSGPDQADRHECGLDGSIVCQKVERERGGQLRLQRADRRVRRPDRDGRHRPHQGRARRPENAASVSGPAPHDRCGHHRDQGEEGRAGGSWTVVTKLRVGRLVCQF